MAACSQMSSHKACLTAAGVSMMSVVIEAYAFLYEAYTIFLFVFGKDADVLLISAGVCSIVACTLMCCGHCSVY
jgi:hypothetical protein